MQRISFPASRICKQCLQASIKRRFQSAAISRASETSSDVVPNSATSHQSAAINPKISTILDQISGLTLLEAADLVQALKSRFNIADVAYAPSTPASSSSAADQSAADQAQQAAPEKPKEKTVFTVNLTKIDTAQKAKAIKEVKAVMPNMNLVEAKKFVESLPKVLKENATKEEAEKLKKALEAIGAEVVLD